MSDLTRVLCHFAGMSDLTRVLCHFAGMSVWRRSDLGRGDGGAGEGGAPRAGPDLHVLALLHILSLSRSHAPVRLALRPLRPHVRQHAPVTCWRGGP
eukprot:3574227-Rhodomonas_salina.1